MGAGLSCVQKIETKRETEGGGGGAPNKKKCILFCANVPVSAVEVDSKCSESRQ